MFHIILRSQTKRAVLAHAQEIRLFQIDGVLIISAIGLGEVWEGHVDFIFVLGQQENAAPCYSRAAIDWGWMSAPAMFFRIVRLHSTFRYECRHLSGLLNPNGYVAGSASRFHFDQAEALTFFVSKMSIRPSHELNVFLK